VKTAISGLMFYGIFAENHTGTDKYRFSSAKITSRPKK